MGIQKKQNQTSVCPLVANNLKEDRIVALEGCDVHENEFIDRINDFISTATKKYERGEKLDGPLEALALSNVFIADYNNSYKIDDTYWKETVDFYKKRYNRFDYLSLEESNAVATFIDEYKDDSLNNSESTTQTLYEYANISSRGIKEVLSVLKNLDGISKEAWLSAFDEEDLLVKSLVEPILVKPYFGNIKDTTMHGNGYPMEESRMRKVAQAKRNGESTRVLRGRASDVSLEFRLKKNEKYHPFICEVKTSNSSKCHYDLGKIGAELKDMLDHALKKGAPASYSVTELLVEGVNCRIYSMILPMEKLYLMIEVAKFSLPTALDTLDRLNDPINWMLLCRGLVEKSIEQLKTICSVVSDQAVDFDKMIESSRLPVHYSDYYN